MKSNRIFPAVLASLWFALAALAAPADPLELAAWPQWLLDGKPGPTGRLTFTTCHHWTKDSPLLESGLIGPVTLRTVEIIPAN